LAGTHTFSKNEEVANAITHGIGALLSIAALAILVTFSAFTGKSSYVVSFTLFGATMVLLYSASTMVHSLPFGKAKNIFEILDHSSIYFFIAGTYTPFLFLVIKGTACWTLFGIVWGLAVTGTVFKSFFVKKYLFTSTLLYIVMGWLIVIAWNQLSANIPHPALILLVAGGILYTLGSIFYIWRGFKYHHAIWHLFVLAGTATHFFAVLYLLP